jgi:tetratricopeptide (TPR) repeat protein
VHVTQLRLVLLVWFTLFAARAAASPNNDKARAHSDAGRAFYGVQDYAAALREFSISYELSRLPALLVNLGQCYRKLKQPARAREMYQRFLDEAAADDPVRESVQSMLPEVEREARDNPAPPASEATTSSTTVGIEVAVG